MRLATCTLVVGLAGCDVFFPLADPPDKDAPTDSPTDSPIPVCYGHDLVQICLDNPPSASFVIPNSGVTMIDTDTGPCGGYMISGAEDPFACVIAATSIQIPNGATLRAAGTRPLVLISATTIVLDGDIDVASSSSNDLLGAGAISTSGTDCFLSPAQNPGGGGPGGSLGGRGGAGGDGDSVSTGGMGVVLSYPTRLRGGCRGGNGADGSLASIFGEGGGAIALIAETIVMSNSGSINASGAGGLGGIAPTGGGGGGGSGGMIILDALIEMQSGSLVFANGGGGGEGSGGGARGCDGLESPEPGSPGPGGDNNSPVGCSGTAGGAGGAGSDLEKIDGSSGIDQTITGGGGGGGGGGAGIIRLAPASQPMILGVLSPAPSS